jgi:hypothetical protein
LFRAAIACVPWWPMIAGRTADVSRTLRHRRNFAIFRSECWKVVLGKANGPGTSFRPDCAGIRCLPSHSPVSAPGVLLQVRLIKGRRFPICPYCREISFELAHSDQAFWRGRSAPGTRYRRHRRSARSQSSNKAVAGRPRAIVRFVGSARRSAILGAIVVAVRGLLALRG